MKSNNTIPTLQNQIKEASSRMDKRNRIPHTKFEVTKEERENILTNAGDSALLLYQFYLRMAAIPDAFMEDSNAASYFNWNIRKVARIRKQLESLNYFKRRIFVASDGTRSVTYYLTEERVYKA